MVNPNVTVNAPETSFADWIRRRHAQCYFQAARTQLARGQRVEHEGVVGIRTMGNNELASIHVVGQFT